MNRPINITALSYIYVSNVLIPDLPLSIECEYKSEGFQELKKLRLFFFFFLNDAHAFHFVISLRGNFKGKIFL